MKNPFRVHAAVVDCPEISPFEVCAIHMDAPNRLTFHAALYEGVTSWWRLAKDQQCIPKLRVDVLDQNNKAVRSFHFIDLIFVSYCPFKDVDYASKDCMVEEIVYDFGNFTVKETDLAPEGDTPA